MEKESMKTEDARPHFFKIIYGEEVKQHLRIPPAFMKHLSQDMSNRATLTGPSGSHWRVTVSKDANGAYLQKGWKQFMKENNLGDNEFLIFRYDGNMQFYVKIFDKSGVRRLAPISGNRTQEETRVSNGKRARGIPGKSNKSPVGSLNLHQLQLHDSEEGPGESSSIGKTSRHFTSKYPHFMINMTKTSVEKIFLLRIPKSFCAAHLPPSNMTFVLRDSAGKAWDVICIYHGRKHYFSGGWGPFVRYNNLKQGDVCIFELVDKDVMQVHVL